MNEKMIIILTVFLSIAAGAYFFHSNTNTTQLKSSQTTVKPASSDKHVEIFYLAHPPAEAIVRDVEAVLAQYPQFQVTKYDFTDLTNEQKIQSYGITEHTPIAIFINGINTFDVEGRSISLVNFPKGDAFVPTLEGAWNYEDLGKILSEYK